MTSRIPSSRSGGRRAGLTALLAGALIAGGAVVATSLPAGAATVDPLSIQNLITLTTDGSDPTKNRVTFNDNGDLATPQDLANQAKSCSYDAAGETILRLSGRVYTGTTVTDSTSKAPGLNGGSIGVVDSTGFGQSCSQVNYTALKGRAFTSEALTIDLDGKEASLGVLDMELQKDAVVLAALYNKDDVHVANVELQSGLAISSNGSPRTPLAWLPGGKAPSVSVCRIVTSSGPNSNVSDNCRWVIRAGLFDRVELRAVSGQFSLEGGADGKVTVRTDSEPYPDVTSSYFSLAVLCTDTNTRVTISGAAGADTDASYQRNTVNADGSDCLTLPTTLDRENGDLVLLKPLGQPFEQGVVTAPWLADPKTDAVNKTEVNFVPKNDATLADGSFAAGWKTIPWCPASLWINPTLTGGPQIYDTALNTATADQAAALLVAKDLVDQDNRVAGSLNDNYLFQYACVFDRVTSRQANGTYKTIDKIYLLGDIFIRR